MKLVIHLFFFNQKENEDFFRILYLNYLTIFELSLQFALHFFKKQQRGIAYNKSHHIAQHILSFIFLVDTLSFILTI